MLVFSLLKGCATFLLHLLHFCLVFLLPGDDCLNKGNILLLLLLAQTVQTSHASLMQLFLKMCCAAPKGNYHSHLLLRLEQFSL